MEYNDFTVIGYVFGVLIALAIHWGIVCGMVWLVSWCLGFVFSWKIATCVWVCILAIRGALKNVV